MFCFWWEKISTEHENDSKKFRYEWFWFNWGKIDRTWMKERMKGFMYTFRFHHSSSKKCFYFQFLCRNNMERQQRQIHRKVLKNYILFRKWFANDLYIFCQLNCLQIFQHIRQWAFVCLCETEMWNEKWLPWQVSSFDSKVRRCCYNFNSCVARIQVHRNYWLLILVCHDKL